MTGTTFSAPLMAGILATYLASISVLFDTTSGKLISAAKQHLIDHDHKSVLLRGFRLPI